MQCYQLAANPRVEQACQAIQTSASAITHSATRPERVCAGFGLADGPCGRLVEAQAVLGHRVDLARQPFGARGEVGRLAGQRQQRVGAVAGVGQQAARAEIAGDPVADDRFGRLPHVEGGSSVRATPSTTTMVFCRSTSSGRVCMSKSSVTSNSSVRSRAIEMVSAGWPWIGSPMARIAWAKAATLCVRRHVAGLEMHLGDAKIVAGDEAVEDFREEAALLLAEPPGDAEIDGDDGAVRLDEQVAGMHVGVEEAVAQRVAQERLDEVGGDRLQVVAGGAQRLDVGQLDAVDPVHGEHVAAGALPVDRRARGSRDRLRVFSASSDRAAASSRRSISILVVWASVSVTSTGRSRRVAGM